MEIEQAYIANLNPTINNIFDNIYKKKKKRMFMFIVMY